MSMKRNVAIVIGVLVVILVIRGASQRTGQPEDTTGETPVIESLSQEDLDNLKDKLEELEFDDLGGLPEEDAEPVEIDTLSQEDLDRLKEALEALEFEDLGGLSGN
jgi:hypothetical protein